MSVENESPDEDSRTFVVATFFDGVPQDGGGYGHKRNMLEVLRQLQSDRLKVVVVCGSIEALEVVKSCGLSGVLYCRSSIHKALCRCLALNFLRRILGRWTARLPFLLDALLRKHHTNLVLFLGPDSRALELMFHNFIFSVWDLCHLEHPEFPEVAHFGEFERREYLYANALPRSVAVITDSEYGRRLISQHYGVATGRIHAAPFMIGQNYRSFSPDVTKSRDVMKKFNLRQPYIFYPAQFWPHKNHKYIIEAVALMEKRNLWVPQIVFCGSDKGALSDIERYALDLGIRDHLVVCGFVEDEYMPYLYKGALALVMPTYFGPTNIPPLEALSLGVPVCYSDLPSFREQLGDKAYYIDLENPRSLVDALDQIKAKGFALTSDDVITSDPIDLLAEHVALLSRILFSYCAKVAETRRAVEAGA